jgi:hypothetical protein
LLHQLGLPVAVCGKNGPHVAQKVYQLVYIFPKNICPIVYYYQAAFGGKDTF